jgi:hypothetical protein
MCVSNPTVAVLVVGFAPAAWAAADVFGTGTPGKLRVLALMLLNPAHIIIDHGHFQYNGISLGLAVSDARCYACP